MHNSNSKNHVTLCETPYKQDVRARIAQLRVQKKQLLSEELVLQECAAEEVGVKERLQLSVAEGK